MPHFSSSLHQTGKNYTMVDNTHSTRKPTWSCHLSRPKVGGNWTAQINNQLSKSQQNLHTLFYIGFPSPEYKSEDDAHSSLWEHNTWHQNLIRCWVSMYEYGGDAAKGLTLFGNVGCRFELYIFSSMTKHHNVYSTVNLQCVFIIFMHM